MSEISLESQKTLFLEARTYKSWVPKPVDAALLRKVYDLMKWAPTSANTQPIHLVFITTPAAKKRLLPAMVEANRPQVEQAPVAVIVAYDMRFYEHLPVTFPVAPAMKDMFQSNEKLSETHALRNGSLQGAYFMLAARALGLDVGAMSGFDNGAVDKEFFADGRFRSNFICTLGYGDKEKLYPRGYRHAFESACVIL
ncbi:MAG: malonic semialdehyde reductase [Alphaproteobacteria bacterium]|nr:malonic semialdehyde reductase [Alphaproteobacteria bacterium]